MDFNNSNRIQKSISLFGNLAVLFGLSAGLRFQLGSSLSPTTTAHKVACCFYFHFSLSYFFNEKFHFFIVIYFLSYFIVKFF